MTMFSDVISSRSDLDWCWFLRERGACGERAERLMHDIGVLQPGGWASWQDSQLTKTGAPAEVTFSQNCDVMSLRTEVADPRSDPKGRVARVCAIIEGHGDRPPPRGLREVISAAQSDGPLRYGAWLGLDTCDKHDATILFAEIPPTAADLTGLIALPAVNAFVSQHQNHVSLQMLSFHGATRQTELFFDATCGFDALLAELATLADVPLAPLRSTVDQLLVAGSPNALATARFGFSLKMADGKAAPELTLQLQAGDFFADDAALTKIIRAYPGDHQDAYVAFSDFLLPAPNGVMHHGTIGLAAKQDGPPDISIGVAAPWACPLDPIWR